MMVQQDNDCYEPRSESKKAQEETWNSNTNNLTLGFRPESTLVIVRMVQLVAWTMVVLLTLLTNFEPAITCPLARRDSGWR